MFQPDGIVVMTRIMVDAIICQTIRMYQPSLSTYIYE